MSRIGFVAAFPAELAPMVRDWRRLSTAAGVTAWSGKIGNHDTVAVAAGMGAKAALRGCEAADLGGGPLDAILSVGWAGALSCGLSAGQAYRVSIVIDASNGRRFPTACPPQPGSPLALVTLGHVAQREEKRKLAQLYSAVMVDMEAAAVAKFAYDKSIVFLCIKAISDLLGDEFSDFSRFADKRGGLRTGALLAHAALRPRYWRSLIGMARNSRTGAAALAETVAELPELLR